MVARAAKLSVVQPGAWRRAIPFLAFGALAGGGVAALLFFWNQLLRPDDLGAASLPLVAFVAAILLPCQAGSVLAEQPAQESRAENALKPIIMDGMIPAYIGRNRIAIFNEASSKNNARPFPVGKLDALADF